MGDDNLTPGEVQTILILVKIFSGVSIVSCFIVFAIYYKFKEQRSFYHEIIIWFTISNCLYSFTSFIPFDATNIDIGCALQSVTLTWFQNSGYVWSAIIGYIGLISLIKRDHMEKKRFKYRIIFLVIAFLIPGLISLM
jgi:hypothetical protein